MYSFWVFGSEIINSESDIILDVKLEEDDGGLNLL